LAPWAGLQLAVAFAFFGLLLLLFDFRNQWKAVLVMATGTIFGSVLLIGLYYATNSLDGFLASILPHASASHSAGLNPWSNRLGALKDPSFVFVTLAFGICTISTLLARLRTKHVVSLRLAALLLAFGLGTPTVLVALSKMPAYYSFFSIIPTLTIIFYTVAHGRVSPRWAGALVIMIIVPAAIFGAPWSMAIAWMHRSDQPLEKIDSFVSGIIRCDDVVLYERSAYYPAKNGAKDCYFVNWYYPRMSDHEKERLTLLFLDRETFELTAPTLGGKWVEVAGPVESPNRNMKALSVSDWYRKNPTIELRA